MAIRFRCKNCKQLLSIATRKAGQVVRCPACQAALSVPRLEDLAPKKPDETKTEQPKQPAEADAAAPPSPPVSEPSTPSAAEETTPPPPTAEETAPPPAAEETVSPEPVSEETVPSPPPAAAGVAAAAAVPSAELDEDEGFSLRGAETEFEEMDLTPMVDVTFLLLIFFMITASFSLQKTIQVPPPDPDEQGAAQAMTMQELEKDSIIVEIDDKNAIVVDDEPLGDPEELVEKLQDKMRAELKTELVLEADERALHEYVVIVVDAANEVGMQRIRLATRSAN
jgi:biopolymer transport protein ExbD